MLGEDVTWEVLESVVGTAAGSLLERVGFGGQYRGKQIDADKKSYVVTLSYRAPDRTLTADEVETCQQAVIAACAEKLERGSARSGRMKDEPDGVTSVPLCGDRPSRPAHEPGGPARVFGSGSFTDPRHLPAL